MTSIVTFSLPPHREDAPRAFALFFCKEFGDGNVRAELLVELKKAQIELRKTPDKSLIAALSGKLTKAKWQTFLYKFAKGEGGTLTEDAIRDIWTWLRATSNINNRCWKPFFRSLLEASKEILAPLMGDHFPQRWEVAVAVELMTNDLAWPEALWSTPNPGPDPQPNPEPVPEIQYVPLLLGHYDHGTRRYFTGLRRAHPREQDGLIHAEQADQGDHTYFWHDEVNAPALRMVLLGEPGSGKTYTTKGTVQDRNKVAAGDLRSIWVAAKVFATELGKQTVPQALWAAAEQAGEPMQTFDLVVVDGLDELEDKNSLGRLKVGLAVLPSLARRILVTCRRRDWEQTADLCAVLPPATWKHFTIQPMNLTAQSRFIRRMKTEESALAERLAKEPALRVLCQTARGLTDMMRIHSELKSPLGNNQLTANDIQRMVLRLQMDKENNADSFIADLAKITWRLLQGRDDCEQNLFSFDAWAKACIEGKKELESPMTSEERLGKCIKWKIIVRQGARYSFRHRLTMEYLASHGLAANSADLELLSTTGALSDPSCHPFWYQASWVPVLCFLFGNLKESNLKLMQKYISSLSDLFFHGLWWEWRFWTNRKVLPDNTEARTLVSKLLPILCAESPGQFAIGLDILPLGCVPTKVEEHLLRDGQFKSLAESKRIDILARLASPQAETHLLEILKTNPSLSQTRKIISALGQFGGGPSVDAFIELLNATHRRNSILRSALITALGKVGGLVAEKYLVSILRLVQDDEQGAVLKALRQAASPAVMTDLEQQFLQDLAQPELFELSCWRSQFFPFLSAEAINVIMLGAQREIAEGKPPTLSLWRALLSQTRQGVGLSRSLRAALQRYYPGDASENTTIFHKIRSELLGGSVAAPEPQNSPQPQPAAVVEAPERIIAHFMNPQIQHEDVDTALLSLDVAAARFMDEHDTDANKFMKTLEQLVKPNAPAEFVVCLFSSLVGHPKLAEWKSNNDDELKSLQDLLLRWLSRPDMVSAEHKRRLGACLWRLGVLRNDPVPVKVTLHASL